ncbi:MAG: UDP-N-acetylglucosamine--N-acetylmuramyl-(pentapeptide) pyrophosphoryl-undecaprenol N-acetylglucosamine transferase [Phycisphaerales bacterium]
MAPHTFIFAGGGTGGHLYPGLAIAHELRALTGPATRCLFLCSSRPIDASILSAAGADFHPISAQPFSLSPRALWRFANSWGVAIRQTRSVIRDERARNPHIRLVALGGFVAAPAVQAAIAERLPITLINLDAVPGKANRWMSSRLRGRANTLAFTTFPVAAPFAHWWQTVPPIVRREAAPDCTTQEARARLGLDPSRPTLMVTGASLGARSINDLLPAFIAANPSALAHWQVLHQTGTDDNSALTCAYAAASIPALVTKFVPDMGLWWRAADLAIARAGAGLVAEAWANAVPTLFLPYPYHKDQHQRLNAQALVRIGGARCETDRIAPAANLAVIGPILLNLLNSPAQRAAMSAAIRTLGPANGSAQIAAALLQPATA